uniref:Protein kinase domain-containing protein n=1 Tax=Pristionchus pacificus TaxID=54126 RepID=A0A8R1YI23_PRIPA
MDNSTTMLAYYFNYDRDLSMGILHKFQTSYCLFSLFTWHPLVLYLLIYESPSLSKEIRNGYIANQIGLLVNEWIFSFVFTLSCLTRPSIATILATGVILPNPPFEYLLLIMHQKLVLNSNSKIRLSKRCRHLLGMCLQFHISQNAMISTLLLFLLINIAGFGIFGRRTRKADEILNRPELAWLSPKGGEVFIFGDIGDPESFAIECYILGAVLVIVFPVVVFFSFHAVYIIAQTKAITYPKDITKEHERGQHNSIAGSTVGIRLQVLRVASRCNDCDDYGWVHFLTRLGMGGRETNSHDILKAQDRQIVQIEFIINPMPQSLIFLIKNHTYRKIIWNKMKTVFISLSPFAYGTSPSVQSSNGAFSHLPSSSITRPTCVSLPVSHSRVFSTQTHAMAEENESIEDMIDEFIDRFDTEINVQTIASRSSIKEEADRYEMSVNQCLDKKLPIFECLTLAFSRKIKLELVNFNETARSLQKCLREEFIQKLVDYDDDAVEEFNERSTKIIHDESEALRESLRASYLGVTGETDKQVVKEVKEFSEIVSANDFKRRCRPTAMNMPLESTEDAATKDIEKEIERRTEEFDGLLKTISNNFTELLESKTRYAKTLIDANINAELPLFGMIGMHFNMESWEHFKYQKQLVNSTVEEILSQISRLTHQPDSFSVTAFELQQKAKELFESLKGQLNSSTAALDKYLADERRDIFRRDAATRPDVDCIEVHAIENEGEILFDGRIRRENAQPELSLEGITLKTDEDGRISTELRKSVILERIVDENKDVEVFAVQKYEHTNLLRCLGTSSHEGIRYLAFEHFPDTLTTTLREHPEGLNKDDFIQFLNGLRQAVEYLHENNLYHGDLRPGNVYFDSKEKHDYYKVKLAHFNMISAREIVESGTSEQNPFSAPEAGPEKSLMLLQKADIWSFGTLIWHALTAVTPSEEKTADLPSTIINDSAVSTIGDFLKRCWSEQPEDRPSIFEIGQMMTQIVCEMAFGMEEDKQWTDECAKWKRAAAQTHLRA